MNSIDTPTPESTPESTQGPIPDNGAAAPTPATVEAPAIAEVEEVRGYVFKSTGLVKGSINFTAGVKVKDLLKLIDANVSVTSISVRDADGKPVGVDRVLNDSLNVSVVQKAAGG